MWCYNARAVKDRRGDILARKHDIILFYSKTKNFFFDGKSAGIMRDTGTKSFGGKIGTDDSR